ncbi:ATP-dependent 6-phosphofructokinase subunit beta [Dissostichus eleginoides]|uniref:ATP-dependent 6-phosphofructokinase subunit beta n=1 Tax=Dissostichus eleginoides TaxID=100907 RepID=A0AAD9C0Y7_DISEL|nr:ATP-dependent 6-phosphofructokinase subunit beta [Dissostichus eleginoides]
MRGRSKERKSQWRSGDGGQPPCATRGAATYKLIVEWITPRGHRHCTPRWRSSTGLCDWLLLHHLIVFLAELANLPSGWEFECMPTIKPLTLRPVKVSEDEAVKELSRPHRSNSKEQLIESSPHSLSGRGYSNMSHSYSPAAAHSQMDENKQDLPKKLSKPFGSSCQFESAGARPSLHPNEEGRSQRAELEVEGAWWWCCGVVGIVCKQRKVQDSRGRKLFPGDAMVLSAACGLLLVLSSDSQSALLQNA